MTQIHWGELPPIPAPSEGPPSFLRRLVDLDDWLTLAAALIAVIAVASSIASADWVGSMPALWPVTTLGLLFGYVMSCLEVHGRWKRLGAAIAGALGAGLLVVVPVTLTAIESGGTWDRLTAFSDRMRLWYDVVVNGGISDDPIPFILLVVSVCWLASYSVAWSLFAFRNGWIAIIPLGLVFMFNDAYREISFDWAFLFFLFAALILLGRAAFQRLQTAWERAGVETPDFLGLQVFWQSLLVVSLLLVVAWLLPAGSGAGAWERVSEPINERVFESNRFFAAVQGTGDTPFRDFGHTLPLAGSIDLRNRVLMQVAISQPQPFLRVSAYQEYDRSGWLNQNLRGGSASASNVPAPADLAAGDQRVDGGEMVSVEIEARRKIQRLAVPGRPVTSDRDVSTEGPPPIAYTLPLSSGAAVPPGLPKDLAEVLPRLQQGYAQTAARFPNAQQPQRFGRLLPPGYQARSVQDSPPEVTVERIPSLDEAITLSPKTALQRGDKYRVLAVAPNASEADLRATSATYPPEIRAFLQLPERFPSRVRDLAKELTAGFTAPYDKALALERYLRTIPYDETIPKPQPGADRVERFLFGTERGYFDYHASAMTVMLRSVGVPARLATGYALQELGEDGRYIVRETHTYSWPEVYFPGVGWVAFNPTPNLPKVERPGDPAAATPSSAADTETIGPPEFDPADLGGIDLPNGGGATSESDGGWLGPVTLTLLALLGIVGLIAVAGSWWWNRSVAALPYAAGLWEKTIRLAIVTGVGPKPEQTPREYARHLSSKVEGASSVERLARAYERARFGARDIDETERAALGQEYRTLRNRLLARLFRRTSR